MSDSLSSSSSNVAEFSVSEISGAIKRTMEDAFGRVRVRGELGRVSRPASGHIYCDLKDERSVLAGVIWKGAAAKMTIRPEEGLEVIATGRITTFAGQSKYQLVIDSLEPAGEGALMALLEERKRKLAAEGLFSADRKKTLPYMPRVIGVITSPSGAVIRDILHRLNDRFRVHVLVWPVRVQGETSAKEVANAIEGFNTLDGTEMVPKPDLLIVARGGGSIEDLWGFNEEIVARAAAASSIPLISAVGHETDTTLIDHVSDHRAPTPTGAAEIAVPVRAELLAHVAAVTARFDNGMTRQLLRWREIVSGLARALPRADALMQLPRQRHDIIDQRLDRALESYAERRRARLDQAQTRLSPIRLESHMGTLRGDLIRLGNVLPGSLARVLQAARRDVTIHGKRLTPIPLERRVRDGSSSLKSAQATLDRAALRHIEHARQSLSTYAQLLDSLSYKSVLSRGYALVRDDAGAMVRGTAAIAAGHSLTIEFADEERIGVRVTTKKGVPRSISKTSAPSQKVAGDDDQGTLL